MATCFWLLIPGFCVCSWCSLFDCLPLIHISPVLFPSLLCCFFASFFVILFTGGSFFCVFHCCFLDKVRWSAANEALRNENERLLTIEQTLSEQVNNLTTEKQGVEINLLDLQQQFDTMKKQLGTQNTTILYSSVTASELCCRLFTLIFLLLFILCHCVCRCHPNRTNYYIRTK